MPQAMSKREMSISLPVPSISGYKHLLNSKWNFWMLKQPHLWSLTSMASLNLRLARAPNRNSHSSFIHPLFVIRAGLLYFTMKWLFSTVWNQYTAYQPPSELIKGRMRSCYKNGLLAIKYLLRKVESSYLQFLLTSPILYKKLVLDRWELHYSNDRLGYWSFDWILSKGYTIKKSLIKRERSFRLVIMRVGLTRVLSWLIPKIDIERFEVLQSHISQIFFLGGGS